MDKYILQKDLPDSKAGDSYVWVELMKAYYKDGDISNSYWTAEYVVGNIEWFKEEPELQWFVIPFDTSKLAIVPKGWTPIRQRVGDMGGYADCQYFPSEDAAIEFILMNKPVLSLKDILIWKNNDVDVINNPHFLRLKELVKSKL